jgi:hypothetical protein
MSEERPSVALSEARTVLLLGPPHGGAVSDGCRSLIHGGDPEHVVVVSLSGSLGEWLEWWERHEGSRPEDLVFVTTGEPPGEPPVGVTVERVSSPNDLTALGIRVADHLERWREAGIRPSVCFDSLTVLLQYVDVETAYKFVHVLTTRIANADARAHFHLDPRTLDERELSTIESVFSAVARHDGSSWNVSSR